MVARNVEIKKVYKMLQETPGGSASWCTNVGNERGEVLVSVSVLTESEGLEGFHAFHGKC